MNGGKCKILDTRHIVIKIVLYVLCQTFYTSSYVVTSPFHGLYI